MQKDCLHIFASSGLPKLCKKLQTEKTRVVCRIGHRFFQSLFTKCILPIIRSRRSRGTRQIIGQMVIRSVGDSYVQSTICIHIRSQSIFQVLKRVVHCCTHVMCIIRISSYNTSDTLTDDANSCKEVLLNSSSDDVMLDFRFRRIG